MAGRNGQELISTWVPADLAARFRSWARGTDGGVSAALRRLISDRVDGTAVAPSLGSAGYRVTVRLKDEERFALLEAAKSRGTSPANWLRSLTIVHLGRRPQWNDAEVAALRDVFTELRRIGSNVNQIARALNVASHTGNYPADQGEAAREAAKSVQNEIRRVASVMTGNFTYWGLSEHSHPPLKEPSASVRCEAIQELNEQSRYG